MAGIFLLFAITMFLIWKGMRLPAITLTIIALAFSLLIFWMHATATLKILL